MTLFALSYLLIWTLAIVLAVVSAVLLYLLAQLQNQNRTRPASFGSRLIGSTMPISSAKDVSSGEMRRIDVAQDGIQAVLALSPDCISCRSLMDELASVPSGDLADLGLLPLCIGDFERCKDAVSNIHSIPVLVLNAREEGSADLWRAGFPTTLVLDRGGVVVDVRHPRSLRGVVDAVKNARNGSDNHRVLGHGVSAS